MTSGQISLAPCRSNRSALQQIERSTGDRPFDVSSDSVNLVTAAGEPIQLLELVVVETESFDELRGNLLLDRAAARNGPDRDPLESRLPLEHLTRTVEAVVVGDHDARDD